MKERGNKTRARVDDADRSRSTDPASYSEIFHMSQDTIKIHFLSDCQQVFQLG